ETGFAHAARFQGPFLLNDNITYQNLVRKCAGNLKPYSPIWNIHATRMPNLDYLQ
ncbi:7342_t:CDS:2, partial [Gigaspora rosea]